MRAAPLPWIAGLVLSGDDDTAGGAVIRFRFEDGGDVTDLPLTAADADRLIAACGGKDEAIGAHIQYQLMPDDSFAFRRAASLRPAD